MINFIPQSKEKNVGIHKKSFFAVNLVSFVLAYSIQRMKIPVSVIFDIGKTNKKHFIFDENQVILEEFSTAFEDVSDNDGYHGEDLDKLVNWLKSSLKSIVHNPKYEVRAVNFSAYGASFVHVDATGKPVAPLYNYLKSFPYDYRRAFFEKYGSVNDFCTATASPDLGMLNSGLQLFWLKNKFPTVHESIAFSLHLPQFCSAVFTQKYFSEKTSIGCHTALWNFKQDSYHQWLSDENLLSKQAPIVAAEHHETAVFEGQTIQFGAGIHDSSAALVPYLQANKEAFILLSTGTWCISFNPFNEEPLTTEQLSKDALCYLTYEGKPVKAARLFSGNEHERQTKHLGSHFGKDEHYFKTIKFDKLLVRSLRERFKQAIPANTDIGLLQDCPFVERNLNAFKSYEEAYHQFILDLIAQQVASLRLVIGKQPIKTIFVEGGFASNEVFTALLSEALPMMDVRQTSLGQASALGAALLTKSAFK